MTPKFSDAELLAREAAMMEYRRIHHRSKPVDESLCAPFMHLTRHKHAQLVDRERMRAHAETTRRNKTAEGRRRMDEANNSYNTARIALEARDRLFGKPT